MPQNALSKMVRTIIGAGRLVWEKHFQRWRSAFAIVDRRHICCAIIARRTKLHARNASSLRGSLQSRKLRHCSKPCHHSRSPHRSDFREVRTALPVDILPYRPASGCIAPSPCVTWPRIYAAMRRVAASLERPLEILNGVRVGFFVLRAIGIDTHSLSLSLVFYFLLNRIAEILSSFLSFSLSRLFAR